MSVGYLYLAASLTHTFAGLFWIDPNYGSTADAFEARCIENHHGIGTCIKPAVADMVSCPSLVLKIWRCSCIPGIECKVYCNCFAMMYGVCCAFRRLMDLVTVERHSWNVMQA